MIRHKILRNEIPPSSHINIDRLSRELEVSSTPVREALKQLQGDNLVVQEVGRGYRTTPLLNKNELREMFEFRLLVEPWAAKVAAQDRLNNPGFLLEQQLDALDEVRSGFPEIPTELIEHDTVFHDTILVGANNEILRSAYSQTHCHLHAFRLFPNDHTGTTTVAEHREIAAAIRHRDPERAEQAMRTHLVTAYLRFSEAHHNDSSLALPGIDPSRPAANQRLSL